MAALFEKEQHLVVVFDMCSSSRIIDDLTINSALPGLNSFHRDLKIFLDKEAEIINFKVYKFMGDGWILLFPPEIEGTKLSDFLKRLCKTFKQLFQHFLSSKLTREYGKDALGITIGIEAGELIKIGFKKHESEYLGRALNVACRLQGAVKDKIGIPFRALVSKQVQRRYFSNVAGFEGIPVERTLRNIDDLGSKFPCYKIDISKYVGDIKMR
jgi:hypothetical protein